MSLRVKPIRAFNGDAILLSFEHRGKMRNILIDGGTGNTYSKRPKALKTEIQKIKERGEYIDLLLVTHVDDDHIGGIIRLFEYEDDNKNLIKKVWFNSGELISNFFNTEKDINREIPLTLRSNPDLSIAQGVSLENSLKKLDCWEQNVIYTGCGPIEFCGSKITILSPDKVGLEKLNNKWETEKGDVLLAGDYSDYREPISKLRNNPFKEDKKIPNKSSIAFLFEYKEKKVLFLADAHPSVVSESLRKIGYSKRNKLEIDLVKVAHHASKKNTSPQLLELIKCNEYLISTNGKRHGLPDKESMARIIAANEQKTRLHFNYDIAKKIFLREDYNDFAFECNYLNDKDIELL